MRSLLKTFILSFTDLNAYPQLVGRSLKSVFLYFLTFYLIFSSLHGWYYATTTLPKIYQEAQNIVSDLNQLPPDLTLTLTDQTTLQTNVTDPPYVLPLSQPLGAITQLLIIDPNAVAEDIKTKQTLFLLTSNTLALMVDPTTGAVGILPWKDLGTNFSFTGQTIINEANRIFAWLTSLKPYFLPLTVIGFFITYTFIRFSFIFFNLLFLYLISHLLGNRLKFQSYLKTGLFTLVLSETLWQILRLLYTHPSPIFFSLTFYLLTVIALSTLMPKVKNA